MILKKKDRKGVLARVISVDGEWCGEGILDFAITFEAGLLKDKELGIAAYQDDGDAIKTDIGYFYTGDADQNGIRRSWFWACCRNSITEGSVGRRSKIGNFFLTDSESAGSIPNNKFFREFKKAIIPYLEEEMRRAFKEYQEG